MSSSAEDIMYDVLTVKRCDERFVQRVATLCVSSSQACSNLYSLRILFEICLLVGHAFLPACEPSRNIDGHLNEEIKVLISFGRKFMSPIGKNWLQTGNVTLEAAISGPMRALSIVSHNYRLLMNSIDIDLASH